MILNFTTLYQTFIIKKEMQSSEWDGWGSLPSPLTFPYQESSEWVMLPLSFLSLFFSLLVKCLLYIWKLENHNMMIGTWDSLAWKETAGQTERGRVAL